MKLFKAAAGFLQETRTEMRKVNWPTQKDAVRYTLFVLGFSAVMAILLGFLDFVYIEILRATILR